MTLRTHIYEEFIDASKECHYRWWSIDTLSLFIYFYAPNSVLFQQVSSFFSIDVVFALSMRLPVGALWHTWCRYSQQSIVNIIHYLHAHLLKRDYGCTCCVNKGLDISLPTIVNLNTSDWHLYAQPIEICHSLEKFVTPCCAVLFWSIEYI